MAEDGEGWNGLQMKIIKSLANFSSKYTNDNVAPLTVALINGQCALDKQSGQFAPKSVQVKHRSFLFWLHFDFVRLFD